MNLLHLDVQITCELLKTLGHPAAGEARALGILALHLRFFGVCQFVSVYSDTIPSCCFHLLVSHDPQSDVIRDLTGFASFMLAIWLAWQTQASTV